MTKVLIDECLSPELALMARERGHHEASHVVWIGKAGWKDWELKRVILEQHWVLVTRNSDDFRGPRHAPGTKGQHADVPLHAGIVCLNVLIGDYSPMWKLPSGRQTGDILGDEQVFASCWRPEPVSDLRSALAGCPIVMTHWDPSMYPDQPIPLIQELVINLLAYGQVVIKDVDLFMNEQIVSCLSQPAGDGISNWDLFASLVRTKRITVLTPDRSRRLSQNTPTYSAARDHATKRGHAGNPWPRFDPSRKAYCRKLDKLLVDEKACRARQTPPSGRNSFADLLHDILTSEHKEWRARDAFRHISPENEDLFASFCVEPAKAIEFLEVAHKQRDIVNRDQGFFRTRLYQCASMLENTGEQWSFENLAQTVYFANELDRERAAGSYTGRLAECPNPRLPSETDIVKVIVEPRVTPGFLEVIATPDLGDVINETLRETGGVMREFWHAAGRSRNPDQEFANSWKCVAEAFGAANARYANERRKRLTSYAHSEKLVRVVECELLGSELALFGFRLVLAHHPVPALQPIVEGWERGNQSPQFFRTTSSDDRGRSM